MNKRNVLIMAGGTGGHVFPGLALADELRRRNFQMEWLGTAEGIESRLVPKADIRLHVIAIAGVRGRGMKALMLSPFTVLRAVWAARRVIAQLKPNLVVGFGGYASGPGGLAAKLSGLPLLIHEQNAIAGTTNKYLARISNRVATAFPGVFEHGEFVGNPVRKELQSKVYDAEPKKEVNLLVLGGSRGAKAINELMPQAFADLANSDVSVLHQCGSGHYSATAAAYKSVGVDGKVVEFIDDIQEAFSWADLVIGRSGASTVTELAVVGLPAIFIPFPFAVDDHQTANANYLVRAGAAEILHQKNLTANLLSKTIGHLINNRQQLIDMGEKAKSVAKPAASKHLADICEELICG